MKQILNWFRRRNLESDLDRELQYHIDRRVERPDAFRFAGAGGAKAGHAGTRRRHTGPGGSARRLADPMAAGLRVRPALLRTVFSPQSVVYRHGGAFARARNRRDHRHLLSGRSGGPARASGPPTRTPGSHRLERRSGSRTAFGSYNLMSYPICRDLQQQERFFEGVLCRAATTVNLSTGGEPKPAAAEIVSGTLLFGARSEPGAGKGIDE